MCKVALQKLFLHVQRCSLRNLQEQALTSMFPMRHIHCSTDWVRQACLRVRDVYHNLRRRRSNVDFRFTSHSGGPMRQIFFRSLVYILSTTAVLTANHAAAVSITFSDVGLN